MGNGPWLFVVVVVPKDTDLNVPRWLDHHGLSLDSDHSTQITAPETPHKPLTSALLHVLPILVSPTEQCPYQQDPKPWALAHIDPPPTLG